jgi:uncharacterized protein (DUF58 family)
MRFLDPVALARLNNLSLQLRRISAEGHATGRHRSALRGLSSDFAHHRAYVPGDELKALDWKVYARQDRFYVREYKTESILTTQLLVDASGSMAFADGGRASKWEHACRLAMALGYLALSKGDAAGLVTFDSGARDFVAPRASLSHLEQLDAALAASAPGGETDLGAALERAAARIKRRSLVVLISDLLGEPERVVDVVKALKARGHELLVLQVLDPAERDFAYEGPVVFEDLEDRSEVYCDAGTLQRSYRAEFERQLRLYEASLHASDIPHAVFYTDVPWDRALSRLLTRRA